MTLIVPLFLLLAIVAYVVATQRRRQRLAAACTEAFERCYAATLPRPTFEMGWSYGEPVFQVAFASKAGLHAAAAANAEFLREIDALCKDRGRKRQFKAQRSVSLRHPPDDEAVVAHCCQTMRVQVGRGVAYSADTGAYSLKASTPPLAISHCPWCGSTLPPGA